MARVKPFRITVQRPDGSVVYAWLDELCRRHGAQLFADMLVPVGCDDRVTKIEQVFVPQTRKALVAWLNEHFNRER